MNLLKRITVTAAGAAMATGLMAGAASASTHDPGPPPGPPPGAFAVTYVVTPFVQGGGGPWASSQVWRNASVTFTGGTPVAPWHCGWWGYGPPPACFAFTASVRDNGTFTTLRGARTPNQSFFNVGRRIRGVVSGNVYGTVSFGTFYASTFPNSFRVPRFYYDFFGISALSWPTQFFPFGTTFGVSPSYWSYTYSAWTRCGFQQWNTNSFTRGQSFFSGNITGCFFFRYHWTA